jgi:hypothetical protein
MLLLLMLLLLLLLLLLLPRPVASVLSPPADTLVELSEP